MLRVIVFLLCVGLIVDTISYYLQLNKKDNFLVFNLFLLSEMSFLFYFFFHILKSRASKISISVFAAIFFGLWLNAFIKFGDSVYNDGGVTLENIFVIILAILYYFRQIVKPDSMEFYKQPRFWVVTAYMLYSAGTFFLFLYIDSFHNNEQQKYYTMNFLFVFIKILLLCIAMFMKSTPPPSQKFQLT